MSKIEIAYYTRRLKQAEGFLKRLKIRYEAQCAPHKVDVRECQAKLLELAASGLLREGANTLFSLPEKAPEPRYEDDLASICDMEAKG